MACSSTISTPRSSFFPRGVQVSVPLTYNRAPMDETRTVTQTHERRAAPAPGQPYLFLAFQCDRPLEKGARFSLAGIDRVTLGRGAALSAERVQDAGASVLKITVPDARMSGTHARLHKVLGRWALEDA